MGMEMLTDPARQNNPGYHTEGRAMARVTEPSQTMSDFRESADWKQDCKHWRNRVLTGRYAHWCMDWDGLPIDETCPEWPCICAEELKQARD
jgi:hypothetical protein